MTLLNFTFQEASPLITYSGSWLEGDPSQDPLASSYNGSFRVAQTAQSSFSLSFVGTAITLFGATRANHGNYTVNLDQQPLFMASGFTTDNEFNKSLWNADQLPYKQHTVTLTNIPVSTGPFFDLDFVSINRQIGQPGDTIHQLIVDDTSPSVNYVGSWASATDVSSAYQDTLHSTKDANAQVSFSFEGASLELYGNYANALYMVTLDNQVPVNMKGLDVDLTSTSQHPQTLLYLVDGLSAGNHTVTLTNSVSNQNRPFFFDYAIIRGPTDPNVTSTLTSNVPSTGLNTTSTPTSKPPVSTGNASGNNSSSGHKPHAAAISGGVVGALAILTILGISALLFIRRRRRIRDYIHTDLLDNDLDNDLLDNEPKPYVLHHKVRAGGDVHEQRQPQDPPHQDPPLSPVHQATVPPSKLRPGYGTHVSNPSASPTEHHSSQDRLESSSSPYIRTAPTTSTNASRSIEPSSQSGSMSQRGTHSRTSSRGWRRSSRGPIAQEQDAGLVVDPEEISASSPLPPAYNPAWSQNRP